MKKLLLLTMIVLAATFAQAQDAGIPEKVTEVKGVIAEQLPQLEEFMLELEVQKKELEERLIVLKYHQRNKEVIEASYLVVDRIGDYYEACMTKIADFQAAWFDQTRNLIDIYTKYGMLKESSGESNDLSEFVEEHTRFLDNLDAVKNMLIAVDVDLQDIKNKI